MPGVGPISRLFWWSTFLARMLWACRVSAFSAAAGLALFGLTVPAQNLMVDLSFSGSWVSELAFWFCVFAATFLMWAFPVHYAARTALADPGWILPAATRAGLDAAEAFSLEADVRTRFAGTILVLPRILGTLPFVALLLGLYWGAKAIDGAAALPAGALSLRQAKWLAAADIVSGILFVLFVWLRQRKIDQWTRSFSGWLVLNIFTVAAIVVTTGYLAAAYLAPIFVSIWTPRALLVPPLFGCSVLGFNWLARKGDRYGVPVLPILIVSALVTTASNEAYHRIRTVAPADRSDGRLPMDRAATAWKVANGCENAPCPRPIVLAIDGGASRAAFAAATFVGDLLDRMPPPLASEAATPGRRLFAISGVSGGAYGAAVIQAALADAQPETNGRAPGDASQAAVRTPCRTAPGTWFRSGPWFRSGTAHGEFSSWLDCLQALTSGDNLSTTIIGLAFRDAFAPAFVGNEDRAALLEESFERNWDFVVRSEHGHTDGGAVCGAKTPGRGLCRAVAHPDAWLSKHVGGWMPLLMLNGTSVRTGRRIVSADLASSRSALDHNGSLYNEAYDVREVMATPCRNVPPPAPLGTHYVDDVTADASTDGVDVQTRTHGTCGAADALDGPDLRLSTAALISARFPLISPPGSFIMKGETALGDQIVDGGYFENSGITTALDVVAAMREVGLDPILVSIGNDPEAEASQAALPRRPAATPLEAASGDSFWSRFNSFVGAPLNALLATRDGHAEEALHAAQAHFPGGGFYRYRVEEAPVLDADHPDAGCRAVIEAVARAETPLKMTKVSMSWWLSAAVQADLDAQRCAKSNHDVMAAILGEIAARR